MAVGADGVRAVQFGALAQGEVHNLRAALFFEGGNVRRGGRDAFAEHLFEDPPTAFDGAGPMGNEVVARMPGMPSIPPRLASVSWNRRMAGPVSMFSRP